MSYYLVTGGAGFVGSHVVAALLARGDQVTVLDNLTQGHRAAVLPPARLIVMDLTDHKKLADVFAAQRFDAVLHFAALSLVGQSMREPLRYCRENAANAFGVAEAAMAAGCTRFILSSTANIFGMSAPTPIPEDAPSDPSSPYGQSKLMVEQGLAWARQTLGLDFSALRYFNAAGSDRLGRLGEHHDPETHLIPLAVDAALGVRPPLTIFGHDYDTPDGTCLRDYVHVDDLAQAHLCVLDRPGAEPYYSVGTGTGCSVTEVINSIARVTGLQVPHTYGPRRPGDPPALVAAARRLRETAGWQPHRSDIDTIVADTFRWRSAHPQGYNTGLALPAGQFAAA